jgi:hypothetical protein
MKNKILAFLATIGLASSVTAVDVNENLKIQGFLDFSYTNIETDIANVSSDSQDLEMDEVEIDFLFNVGDVSGEVHVDNDGDGNADFDVEQAHFSYTIDQGVTFTFGRYGRALGFEREDPAGLYTFSRAYGDVRDMGGANRFPRANTFNLGNVDSDENNVHGVAVSYAADSFSVRASIENPHADVEDGPATGTLPDRKDLELDNLDLEVSISYTGIENVNIGVGYLFDNEELNTDEEDILNAHISTSLGKLFLAAEYTEINTSNTAGTGDLDAYMLLADYDFTDKLGAAFRISSNETNNANEDYDCITIAPNYAITDSLGAIIEYSDIDQGNIDVNALAVELTYTF